MKILAIGAHPDDIEFGVSPILIKEKKKGAQILMVITSRGESGSSGTSEEREQESRNAAKLIGAEIEFLDFGGDAHVDKQIKHAIQIAKIIRTFRPDTILCPSLTRNQHADHYKVAEMTKEAARFARYGGYEELKELAVHKVSNIFHYFITSEIKTPDIFIDVSDVYAEWTEVIRCHASQMRTADYVDLLTARARMYGISIGTQYACGLDMGSSLQLTGISDIHLPCLRF